MPGWFFSSTVCSDRNPALQLGVRISHGSVHTAANAGENAGKDAASVRVMRHTGAIGGPWVMGPTGPQG